MSLESVEARFSLERYPPKACILRAGPMVADRGTLFQVTFIELLSAFA